MSEFDDDFDMYVTKRSGETEILSYKKILERTKKIGSQFNINLNYSSLVMKIMDQLFNNIKTSEIDELMCQTCASLGSTDYDYYRLASALCISNHQKEVSEDFELNYQKIYNNDSGYLSKTFLEIIHKHADYFKTILDYSRDYEIDYFGYKTLERAYLMKYDKQIHERIQHMWLRVAIQIHGDNMEKVKETYDGMSQKYFIHATPTLFNSGTKRPQLSSCYLIGMEDDSIDGIFNTLHDCASISKWAGGIGLHIHNIRAKGTQIIGTNGVSNGLVPMLRVFNNTARYVDQCVVPETYIYTKNGPKQIQYVQKGVDEIYNEQGGLEVIQNVLEHPYNGEILEIKTMHSIESLKITPEHPVLAIQNQQKGTNYDIIKNRLNKNLISIEYVEAKEIDENTMLAFKIPQYSYDYEHITEEDCYLYGLMLGDGYMSDKGNLCSLTFHTENKNNCIKFVKDYMSKNCIHITETNNGNENGLTTKLIWSKGVDFKFTRGDIYTENGIKCMSSKMLNLPVNKCKQIVKGLIHSDGCIHDEITLDSTSRIMIEQFKFILLKMGIPTSGYVRDRVGESHELKNGSTITNKLISYCVRVPKTNELIEILNLEKNSSTFSKFMTHNNYIFTRVKNISSSHYEGVLYDLQMEKEHNYMIHNSIVHNGGGKRSGSFAMYLEPWHADIEVFLELRKNHGDEEARARDLFYALWIPDLFMKKVSDDDYWYLMCPNECPGLADSYGEDFENLYNGYVEKGNYKKKMKARELWFQVLDSQMETGTPYMLYKDACNKKSNQSNLGVIKSSNLCTEIIEYSDKDETAVCNLASIGLSKMVNEETKQFDYTKLLEVTETITENLNNIIDKNFYPTKKTYRSNMNHRPIGIGVQGLADVFARMDIPFDSDEAQQVNKNIFETIYYGSMKKSNEISRSRYNDVKNLQKMFITMIMVTGTTEFMEWFIPIFEKNYYEESFNFKFGESKEKNIFINDLYHKVKPTMQEIFGREFYKQFSIFIKEQKENHGYRVENYNQVPEEMINYIRQNQYCGCYSSFEGSPMSQGKFQFDLWNVTPSDRYEWDSLRKSIMENGTRNSLCVAPMPTASTSQILANNECFEPFTSNIYSRRTLAGEFVVINKYLMKELKDLGIWSKNIKNRVIENKGSIQKIEEIPEHIRNKYKIVWDISMKRLIDMAKDRGAFICQSQSMNLWIEDPNYNNLTKMHFYAWRSGLKTGIYYLRRKAKHQAQQFTIEPTKNMSSNNISAMNDEDNHEVCEMCSG